MLAAGDPESHASAARGDGTFRIAIAHRDPGLPHWLDTAGHSEGGAIFRWLLPEGDRERPTFRVIKI